MGKGPRLGIGVMLVTAPYWLPESGRLVDGPASAAQACHLVVRQAKACIPPASRRVEGEASASLEMAPRGQGQI